VLSGRFVQFGQWKFFRCGRPHFWGKKLQIFRNLWCVRTARGLSQCGHFSDKVGQFFTILCRRVLWTGWTVFHDFVPTCFMDDPLCCYSGHCSTEYTKTLSNKNIFEIQNE